MKSTKKVLISAFATMALSAALIGGSTFALFTSQSTTNISVSTGSVSVVATIENKDIELTSSGKNINEDAEAQSGYWANGGTATFADNKLTVTGMTPGDKLEFKITITNASTISVQYQTVATYDTSLWGDQLNINFNGAQSAWAPLPAAGTTVTVTVELLDKEDNYKVMGETLEIEFTVRAVQANGNGEEVDWN